MSVGHLELRTRTLTRVLIGDFGTGARWFFVDTQTGEATPTPIGVVAHRCSSCDAIVITGEGLGEAFDCFECGAKIPTDAESCPDCGWTW